MRGLKRNSVRYGPGWSGWSLLMRYVPYAGSPGRTCSEYCSGETFTKTYIRPS
ncbi:hypothetical protein [Streptomyces sp. NPDC048309]